MWQMLLCSFVRSALTKRRKLDGLKQHRFDISVLEVRNPTSGVKRDMLPLRPAGVTGHLAAPQTVAASLQPLPLSSQGHLPVCICLL